MLKTRLEVCMISGVSFRGGETVGSVSDRKPETSKQETTGGVGVRKNNDSIFAVDNEPKQDTVCFRGYEDKQKKNSVGGVVFGTLVTAAAVVGLLGLAHKYDVVNKYIKNPKAKDILGKADVVTEPCHRVCKWVKNNSYDKVVKYFSSKK